MHILLSHKTPRHKYSPWTLVSGDVTFVRLFDGIPQREGEIGVTVSFSVMFRPAIQVYSPGGVAVWISRLY